MRKRIVSMMIAILMVVGMIPLTVEAVSATPAGAISVTAAGSTEYYDTFYDAILAAMLAGSATVVFHDNVTSENTVLISNGEITIDLNGKTVDLGQSYMGICDTANVTITDTSAEQSGRLDSANAYTLVLYGNAKLEIASGTIDNTNNGTAILTYMSNLSLENAELVVSGGLVTTNGAWSIMAGTREILLQSQSIEKQIHYNGGSLTLLGDPSHISVSFANIDYTNPANGVYLPEGYRFYDEYDIVTEAPYNAICTIDKKEAEVYWGTSADNLPKHGTWDDFCAALTEYSLYDGEEVSYAKLCRDIQTDHGLAIHKKLVFDLAGYDVTIYDRIIATSGDSDITILDSAETDGTVTMMMENYFLMTVYDGGSVSIEGGNFVTAAEHVILLDVSDDSTVTITGGTFKAENNNQAINNDGTLIISGGTVYSANAMAINNNGTLILKGDVEVSGGAYSVYFNKGTLDMSEHADPSGFSVRVLIDTTVGDKIKLPEEYVMVNDDGRAVTAIHSQETYTVVHEDNVEKLPTITGISFDHNHKNYDAATNTFTVDADNPFLVTLTGVNLDLLDDNQGLVVRDENNNLYGFRIKSSLPYSATETEIVVALNYYVVSELLLYYNGIKGIGYTNDYVYVDETVPVNLTVGDPPTDPYVTDMYVPDDVDGYDPDTNTFTATVDRPFVVVFRGKNFLNMSDNWCLVLQSPENAEDYSLISFLDWDDVTITDGEIIMEIPLSEIEQVLAAFPDADELVVGYCTDPSDPNTFAFSNIKVSYGYAVAEDSEHGIVEIANGQNPGDTAVITLTPDEGYDVGDIIVTDGEGNPVDVDENNSFTVPESGATVTVIYYMKDAHKQDGYDIVWSESFDAETFPEDFTSVDADGDGYGWFGNEAVKDHGVIGCYAHDCRDGHSIASPSYINSKGLILDSRNLLLFPTFDLKENREYLLTFMVTSQDAAYLDSYDVHISLDGGETYVWSRGITQATESWEEIKIDLTPYAGKSVTVVIEHKFRDGFYLVIDCCNLHEKITLAGTVAEIESLQKALDEAVKALEAKIAEQDDSDAIMAAIDYLVSVIDTLDSTYATDAALAEALAADEESRALLEVRMEAAEAALDEAVQVTEQNLADAKAALEEALAAGDEANAKALTEAILTLNEAIDAAEAAAGASDSDLRNELTDAMKAADATLDAAIKAVQEKLSDAKAELDQAIAEGDTALDDKVTALSETLAAAKEALEATDAADKEALSAKIDEAYASLDSAIRTLRTTLDDVKAAMEAKDKALSEKDAALTEKAEELQTYTTVVCVIACVALGGSGALAIWFFLDKKKRI